MKGTQMAPEDVYAVALNTLQATAEAPTKNDAMLDAHQVLQGLDEAALRRIAACLATEVAWSKLPATLARTMSQPASQIEVRWRPAVRQWVEQLRLEVAWHAPDRAAVSEEAS